MRGKHYISKPKQQAAQQPHLVRLVAVGVHDEPQRASPVGVHLRYPAVLVGLTIELSDVVHRDLRWARQAVV